MINRFTIAGPLVKDPEEKTMKNGSRFISAIFACSRRMETEEIRLQLIQPQTELIEVNFFDHICMERLRNSKKNDCFLITGYIHTVAGKRKTDNSEYLTTLLIGTDLQTLQSTHCQKEVR